MGAESKIEWTDATWNPTTGCSKVSPGCAHCYAEALSLRYGWSKQPWAPEHAAENVVLHPERLDLPTRWQGHKRIFVNSMSDLFHELVPDDFIDQVFAVMALSPRHTFQVLTKRPERMWRYLTRHMRAAAIQDAAADLVAYNGRFAGRRFPGSFQPRYHWPLPNVWLGTSIENQHWADVRIPALLHTPAAVRFLSCEPLLGPLDLQEVLCPATIVRCTWLLKRGLACPPTHADTGIHWVITGGESGPHYRPFDPAWASAIRDQCQAAGVAFLHKQNGGRTPKAGGRLLDGRTWDQYPDVAGRALAEVAR